MEKRTQKGIHTFGILACVVAGSYVGIFCLYSYLNGFYLACETGSQAFVLINGDDELSDYCSTGNGSRVNPYIIEDLVIDDRCAAYGMQVVNVSKHLVIQNCTILNIARSFGTPDVLYSFGGIKLQSSSNVTIRNCTITSCKENGILAIDVENVLIESTVISGIEYYGITLDNAHSITIQNDVLRANDYGLILFSCWNVSIRSNNMMNNRLYGIEVAFSNNSTIENNTVIHNSNKGIYLINSDDNTLAENIVENNTRDGVVLESANNNIITGNTIRGNTRNGLFLDYYWIADYDRTYYHCSKNNIVTENVITNNDNGVLMVRASGNKLINNSLENNAIYSIQLANSSGNVIHGNSLSGCIAMDSSSTDNDIFPEPCYENVEYSEDEGSTGPIFYGYVTFICIAIAAACILCAVVVFRKKHRRQMISTRMI